ncbi:hypothetical protein MPNT_50144 [Candidatus Methylacidithermus pantelleriae]|uniref:Uncharacterized protein n=1 Tax=Candidatus Methylacidithermus pantelleriae TaxID=2744239 RepID=A0A8J2FX33_9BACT|nr:hypothetical protein MPNT_50144 [Candidatus Methylacidithermus pantelleriae]
MAAAPCTAMVFVWSQLCRGEPQFTRTQVALNDTIMLVAYGQWYRYSWGFRRSLYRGRRSCCRSCSPSPFLWRSRRDYGANL